MDWDYLRTSYDATAAKYEVRFLDELRGNPADPRAPRRLRHVGGGPRRRDRVRPGPDRRLRPPMGLPGCRDRPLSGHGQAGRRSDSTAPWRPTCGPCRSGPKPWAGFWPSTPSSTSVGPSSDRCPARIPSSPPTRWPGPLLRPRGQGRSRARQVPRRARSLRRHLLRARRTGRGQPKRPGSRSPGGTTAAATRTRGTTNRLYVEAVKRPPG